MFIAALVVTAAAIGALLHDQAIRARPPARIEPLPARRYQHIRIIRPPYDWDQQ